MVKKLNSIKKVDNKKNIIAVVICAIISLSVLLLFFGIPNDNLSTTPDNLSKLSPTLSDYLETIHDTHVIQVNVGVPYFNFYFSPDGIDDINNNGTPLDGARITLNSAMSDKVISSLKPNENTVVIYPIFTSAAYQESGFYSYYAGDCDESCITDISFETPEFIYTSSGFSAQILYSVGYEFLTDIEVDKNPELLKNYDTVILLHSEYVTQKMFDAITSHPKLIFLHPNALYAEIEVDYGTNTMTLIRGHNYPEVEIGNGFDYAVEKEFHDYEYDSDCLDWEFVEIENGYHLNCYPEGIIHKNLDILIKMKDL